MAFTLAVSASNYKSDSNAPKLAWICFIYIRAKLLKDKPYLIPTLSLMLAVLSILFQPPGQILTKFCGSHNFPDRASIECSIKYAEAGLEELVREKILLNSPQMTDFHTITQQLCSPEHLQKNIENLSEEYKKKDVNLERF